MSTIFTTTTQLAAADLARYRKQYTKDIPEVPKEEDILELEVISATPRGAVVTVKSPDGFGPAHMIKLKRSDMQGDTYLGTYHKTKNEALRNIANYHVHRVRMNCDDITIALQLPYCEYPTHIAGIKTTLDPLMAWDYIEKTREHLNAMQFALIDMYTTAKEAKCKRMEEYQKTYDSAPKGKLLILYRELDNDTFYLSLLRERPLPADPISSALNRDPYHRLIKATRRGSGFRYQELLGIYDHTANWYDVKLTHAERFSDQWSTVADAYWMEKLSSRKQQEF